MIQRNYPINSSEKRLPNLGVGEAFLYQEAWQSGLSHRSYPPADLWASKPLAGSRQFESDRFHHQSSGTASVAPETAPINRPGDEPEANDHLDNIRLARRFARVASAAPLHMMKDELHEHSFPRPANSNHRLPH
jgi:hypothetical protein